MIFKLLISTAVFHFAYGITLSCVPSVPRYLSNMTCTCSNSTKNGVEWRRNSQTVTICSGTKDKCFPPSLKYRFSVSSDEFYWEVGPYSYTDCATYTCKDLSTAYEFLITTWIADFDQRSITAQEPGANTDGQIKVITGCVFSTTDITVTWYKIENGKEEDFTASRSSPIQSSDRSDCSRTCNTETDKKVESGFTHTEYTGSDYVEVEYKVTVTHNLYINEVFTWTSSKYRLKADCNCECVCGCKRIVIASIVFGILGALSLFIVIGGILTGCLIERRALLVSDHIGIVCDVLSFVLSIVVKVKECCEDCEDWILDSAIAFITISCAVALAAIAVCILVYRGVIGAYLK